MANPTTNMRSSTYVQLQTAKQTSLAAFAITDALHVRSHTMRIDSTPVRRQGHDTPHDGGLKALAGIRRCTGTIEVDRINAGTAGSSSTWQQAALWRACQHIQLEDVAGNYIKLTPSAGRVPFVHFELCQIAKYTRDGMRRACYNASFAYEGSKIEPGGTIVDTFSYEGFYVADADYNVDDVAQVATIEIDSQADGVWSVRLADDQGNVETVSYTAAGEQEEDIASELSSLLNGTTALNSTVSGAGMTATAAAVGRVVTITVTPPAGGEATVTVTTAAVCFSERPSYQNHTTPVVPFAGTITHAIAGDAVLNCGAIEISTGAKLESKVVLASGSAGDAANGYGLARVPAIDDVTLTYEADVPKTSDYDFVGALVAQTELSFTYVQTSETYFAAAQCTLVEAEEGERAGDRLLTAKLGLHSSGAASDMFEMRVY